MGVELIPQTKNHPSGYETHSLSSIFNWLDDEWASIYSKCFHVRFPFYFLLS